MLTTLLLLALVLIPAVSADDPFTLTVLHTNDTHARIESFTEGGVVQGGMARRYTAIQQVKAEGGNVLLVDAGDYFQGTLFFNYWQGQEAAYFMSALGYQAAAIGNHEFDSGPPALANYINAVDFPVLGANIDASAQVSLTGLIEPYTIIEVGGESIGVFGLTTEDTTFISSPGPDVVFNDVTTTAQATVDALAAMGVDKIVALTHIGYDFDKPLAAAVSGIDIIVGGHSHTPLGPMPNAQGDYPTVVTSLTGEPVLIVSAWEWGRYLGRLDVTFDDMGIVQSYNGAPIFIDASIPEDPDIAAAVAVFAEPIEELRATVIGATTVDLDGARRNVRSKETNMGNLICDALLWKTKGAGSQICITNGGGIRASIETGDVTVGDVLTVLPFGNQVATLGLTGTDLLAALENGASRWEFGDGRFAQVAGMRYSFDPEQPAGHRILSAELQNADGSFTPVDPDEIYIIVTNDFLRRGGDGYTMFRDNAIDPYDTWAVMADSVIEYIQMPEADGGLNGVVTPEAYPAEGEGRITKVTADVNRSRRFNVGMDTFIDGSRPALNFGSASTMWAGYSDWMRPIVKADFPVCDDVHTCILPNALVDKAYLYVYVTEGRGYGDWAQSTLDVSVHAVQSMWDENTANWTTPWSAAGGDVGPALNTLRIGSARIGTWWRFDVTEAVQDMVRGDAENYGFAISSAYDLELNKGVSPEGLTSTRYGLATGQYWDPSKVGYLRIMYRTYE
jgi:5'-nucleotidase